MSEQHFDLAPKNPAIHPTSDVPTAQNPPPASPATPPLPRNSNHERTCHCANCHTVAASPAAAGDAAAASAADIVHPPLETSVDVLLQKFWAAKATGCQAPTDFALNEVSWSSRWRHNSWAVARRRVHAALLRTQQSPSRVQAFCQCGSHATIYQSDIDLTRFQVRSLKCHDRLCTPCAIARSRDLHDALAAQINGRPVTFLTLTLRHGSEPLTELLDKLYKCFRNLRAHPLWDEKVEGGAAFLEVKRDDDNKGWHPHLHILMDSAFIDVNRLREAWRSITGGSYWMKIDRVNDPRRVQTYVTKYVTKSLDGSFCNTPAWLDEAVEALKGRRLCLCFGTWYGTALSNAEDEPLADDLVDASGWHSFSSVDALMDEAAHGSRSAWAILANAGLRGHALAALAKLDSG